jgi:hypothetical protein
MTTTPDSNCRCINHRPDLYNSTMTLTGATLCTAPSTNTTAANTVLFSARCNGQIITGGNLYHSQDCPMHGLRVEAFGGFYMQPREGAQIVGWIR